MVRAIRREDESQHRQSSIAYTPDAATRTLPLVRRVVKDLLGLRKAAERQQVQMDGIKSLSETIDRAAYRDELDDIQRGLDEQQARMRDCIDELRSLGLEASEPFDGHIDFPAIHQRRRICLCWQPTDESVEYWHEIDEPPTARKKIDGAMMTSLAT